MAKFLADAVLENGFQDIIDTADQLVVCAGQPSNYSDATTDSGSGGNALGEVALAGGDFTKADGDTSGRKVTVAEKTVTIDVAGTADHIAIVDDGDSELLAVTTMSNATVSVSESKTVNAFDIEYRDPS